MIKKEQGKGSSEYNRMLDFPKDGAMGNSLSSDGDVSSYTYKELEQSLVDMRLSVSAALNTDNLNDRIKAVWSLAVSSSAVISASLYAFNSDALPDRQGFWEIGCSFIDKLEEAMSKCIDSLPDEAPRLRLNLSREYLYLMRMKFLWYAAYYRAVPDKWWVNCFKAFGVIFTYHKSIDPEKLSGHHKLFLREFIHTIVCSICSFQSLNPAEIFIVNNVLTEVSADVKLSSEPLPFCRFFFNLDEPEKSVRPLSEKKPDEKVDFYLGLENIGESIVTAFDVAEYPSILEVQKNRLINLLKIQWGGYGESRRLHERHEAGFEAFGVFGYENILGIIKTNPREYLSKLSADVLWKVTDMSASSFGVVIPDLRGSPIVIHTILALALPKAMSWRICLVRRFKRTENDSGFIGIEVLSAQPAVAFFEGKKGDSPIVKRNVFSFPDYDSLKDKLDAVNNVFLIPTNLTSKGFDCSLVSVMSGDCNQSFAKNEIEDVFSETTLIRCFSSDDGNSSTFPSGIDDWFLDS